MRLSIILPVMNETYSLTQTVDVVNKTCEVYEYVVVTCDRTTSESRAVIAELAKLYPTKLKWIEQKRPFVGGAVRDAFDVCTGSHVVLMSSDLETDPYTVSEMVVQSLQHPDAIVTASRWRRGVAFSGYNPVKLMANWLFQKVVRFLYRTPLTDATFGFRLFPIGVVREIDWVETRHPFFLETILKPILMGVPVIEISSGWTARTEGVSQNPFWRNFDYFRILFRYRFGTTQRDLLRKKAE